MSGASSTDTAKAAAIYRKAAELVHEGWAAGFSCWCIDDAADEKCSKYRRDYVAALSPNEDDFIETWQFGYDWRAKNHRIIALLMMAAMVEAGDA